MISADSFNRFGITYGTPHRQTGRRRAARRQLLDAQAVDLRGTRAHAHHRAAAITGSPTRKSIACWRRRRRRRGARRSRRERTGVIVAISGRNQLRGFVDEVRVEGLLAQVRLRIGDQTLTAVITRDAVEELKLRRGDEALAIVKSTEVMIAREADRLRAAAARERAPPPPLTG